jgi:hypothetical protein
MKSVSTLTTPGAGTYAHSIWRRTTLWRGRPIACLRTEPGAMSDVSPAEKMPGLGAGLSGSGADHLAHRSLPVASGFSMPTARSSDHCPPGTPRCSDSQVGTFHLHRGVTGVSLFPKDTTMGTVPQPGKLIDDHPTLDLLHDLGLYGMAKGLKELETSCRGSHPQTCRMARPPA